MVRVRAVELELCLERHIVSKTTLKTLFYRVARSIEIVVKELKHKVVASISDWEILCKNLVKTILLALLRRRVELEKVSERLQLNVQEVRIRHWILYRCKVDSVVDDLGHLDIWGLYICRASSLLSRPTLT